MTPWISLCYRVTLSKRTCIILLGLFLGYMTALVYASSVLEGYTMMEMYIGPYWESYLEEALLLMKVFSVFVVVALVASIHTDQARNLGMYLITSKKDRMMFASAVYLTETILTIGVVLIAVMSWVMLTMMFTPYTLSTRMMFDVFTLMLLQAFSYQVLTHLLMIGVPSFFTTIIPIGFFWFMELNRFVAMEEDHGWKLDVYQSFPHMVSIDMFESNHFHGLRVLVVLSAMTVFSLILQIRHEWR